MRALIAAVVLSALSFGANALDAYGFTIGEPVNLQECQKRQIASMTRYDVVKETCLQAAFPTQSPLDLSDGALIAFPYSDSPQFATTNTVAATFIGGRLEAIRVYTTGIASQKEVLDALTTKYGTPTASGFTKASNAMGATFDVVEASWNLPDGLVLLTGSTGRINQGMIFIGTEVGKKAIEDQLKKAIKKNQRAL